MAGGEQVWHRAGGDGSPTPPFLSLRASPPTPLASPSDGAHPGGPGSGDGAAWRQHAARPGGAAGEQASQEAGVRRRWPVGASPALASPANPPRSRPPACWTLRCSAATEPSTQTEGRGASGVLWLAPQLGGVRRLCYSAPRLAAGAGGWQYIGLRPPPAAEKARRGSAGRGSQLGGGKGGTVGGAGTVAKARGQGSVRWVEDIRVRSSWGKGRTRYRGAHGWDGVGRGGAVGSGRGVSEKGEQGISGRLASGRLAAQGYEEGAEDDGEHSGGKDTSSLLPRRGTAAIASVGQRGRGFLAAGSAGAALGLARAQCWNLRAAPAPRRACLPLLGARLAPGGCYGSTCAAGPLGAGCWAGA